MFEIKNKVLIKYKGNEKIVTIPDGVEIINEYAFHGCASIHTLIIPSSVKEIKAYAFQHCYRLVEVYNLSNVNLNNDTIKTIHKNIQEPSNIIKTYDGFYFVFDKYNYYLFDYEGIDTTLNLPKNIEGNNYMINDYAFSGYKFINKLIISKGVMSFGMLVFENEYIEEITVHKENQIFDSRDNCDAIIETKCNKLILGCKNTIIPNGVISIGDCAFSCCLFEKIEIPTSVTSIGSWAFAHCNNLTNISIPENVTRIEEFAFFGCRNLKEITLTNSVLDIDFCVFDECDELEHVYFEGDFCQWSNISFDNGNECLFNACLHLIGKTNA